MSPRAAVPADGPITGDVFEFHLQPVGDAIAAGDYDDVEFTAGELAHHAIFRRPVSTIALSNALDRAPPEVFGGWRAWGRWQAVRSTMYRAEGRPCFSPTVRRFPVSTPSWSS